MDHVTANNLDASRPVIGIGYWGIPISWQSSSFRVKNQVHKVKKYLIDGIFQNYQF